MVASISFQGCLNLRAAAVSYRSGAVLALVATLFGCAGAVGPLAPPISQSSVRITLQIGAHHVYVSQTNGGGTSYVFEFGAQNKRNHAPICSIAGSADVMNLASDAFGDVYVPDGATDTVSEYSPDCGKRLARISDQFGLPSGVLLAGSAIYLPSASGIAVCGRNGCSSNLTDASIFEITSAAVDARGDVWAANYDQRFAISLVVWRRGSMPGHVVSGYSNTLSPGDIVFDKNDTLISIEAPFSTLTTFQCHARSAACAQTGSFPLHGASNFGALNAVNTDFQVADYRADAIDVYAYPTFDFQYSYDAGLKPGFSVVGVAQVP
jgi:hypothetical protein